MYASASPVCTILSQSLPRRRFLTSRPNVRSTIQRLGSTLKPLIPFITLGDLKLPLGRQLAPPRRIFARVSSTGPGLGLVEAHDAEGEMETEMPDWWAASPEDREWANLADEFKFEALPQIRSAAEKWTTTITSLTGVFSLIALIKRREDITDLKFEYEVAVAICLGVALLLAFVAIRQADLAAQGNPTQIYNNPDQLEAQNGAAIEDARNKLQSSRVLVVPATLLIAVAIGITWFGPTDAATSSVSAVAIRQTGTTMCGVLSTDSSGNLLLATNTSGSPTPLEDTVTLNIVDQCP